MSRIKFKFRLHKAVIVLLCLALLVVLMQGASWFSRGSQQARTVQLEELARTLGRQVAFTLVPVMKTESPDQKRIGLILDTLTNDSRVLDAAVYDASGRLIARAGESINVRDRLALDGPKAGSYFNKQIVSPVEDKSGPIGYLRFTLDTHSLATEARQVDNTTSILRLMLLAAVATGMILARTLLGGKRSRWQQSPFLLTANSKVKEDDDEQR